ncbi:hypothetical protein BGW36DRAFT_454896 [Talaromyces proteolyticus]|uniref:Macro domain-like protein n=1 Tax=Talaromyces proteolyticus TaxID=1131652 RepID=A0AAD4KRA7_9EURO|nr:uncharacterized protein BGW36DRAFT_454896 [Talaromyces proteolyticus]KAH8694289.1 hypothetical protein BGW36DRAFT_454896 [Talaromyces proteolyticus]
MPTYPQYSEIRLLFKEKKNKKNFVIINHASKHAAKNTTSLHGGKRHQTLEQALHTTWPIHAQSFRTNTINENLRSLPKEHQFDLIVSIANSNWILGGGFDDAISRTFCLPKHDYRSLTDAAQRKMYDQWRGFSPPGTYTIVTLPPELQATNQRVCKYLALCPTMRSPSAANWNRDVVYESIWSLLCEVDRWNSNNTDDRLTRDGKINRILMTPLATGTGGVSTERWAKQLVLALKHFSDALENPQRWRNLEWAGLYHEVTEVERTWVGSWLFP